MKKKLLSALSVFIILLGFTKVAFAAMNNDVFATLYVAELYFFPQLVFGILIFDALLLLKGNPDTEKENKNLKILSIVGGIVTTIISVLYLVEFFMENEIGILIFIIGILCLVSTIVARFFYYNNEEYYGTVAVNTFGHALLLVSSICLWISLFMG